MIYQPAEDSFLLEKYVKIYSKGRSFLDLGSGSGIQSLAAKSAGAKSILASDINVESVSLIKKLGFKSVKSDLFSNIKDKFDLIAFNPPYLPKDEREDAESALVTSGGKEGDEIYLKFLNQAVSHLKKKGIILIVLSSLTPKGRIERKLKELHLKKKSLEKINLFMECLEVWEITNL